MNDPPSSARPDLLEAACDLLWSLAFNNALVKVLSPPPAAAAHNHLAFRCTILVHVTGGGGCGWQHEGV